MLERYYSQQMRMKRKDLDEVNDDLSDISLSSPARKIRRLDAELPPIMEDEEMEIPIVEQPRPERSFETNVAALGREAVRGIVIEELPDESENMERAIVPFRPTPSPFVVTPSDVSVTVNPQLVSGIKYQVRWSNQPHLFVQAGNEDTPRVKNTGATDNCASVVPSMPCQVRLAAQGEASLRTEHFDMMDADKMEASTMEVEDNNVVFKQNTMNEAAGTNLTDGLHQWPQPHCMVPQLPQNTITPIVWYQ